MRRPGLITTLGLFLLAVVLFGLAVWIEAPCPDVLPDPLDNGGYPDCSRSGLSLMVLAAAGFAAFAAAAVAVALLLAAGARRWRHSLTRRRRFR
jgi:hypothetical protein